MVDRRNHQALASSSACERRFYSALKTLATEENFYIGNQMAVCVPEDHTTPGGGQSSTKDLKMMDITVEELAVTLVLSRLDYGNATLYGLPGNEIDRHERRCSIGPFCTEVRACHSAAP